MSIRGMIIVAIIFFAGWALIGILHSTAKLVEPRLPTLKLVRQIEQCDRMGGYPLFDVNGRREAAAVTCRVMVGDE